MSMQGWCYCYSGTHHLILVLFFCCETVCETGWQVCVNTLYLCEATLHIALQFTFMKTKMLKNERIISLLNIGKAEWINIENIYNVRKEMNTGMNKCQFS